MAEGKNLAANSLFAQAERSSGNEASSRGAASRRMTRAAVGSTLRNCRYVRSCETSRFIALLGWEDVCDDPERSRDSA